MSAQFNLFEVVFKFTEVRGDFVVVERAGSEFSPFTANQLIVFKGKCLAGVRHNGRAIGGHHKFFVANTHQQRRTPPGGDQNARLTDADHGDGESPFHLVQRRTHGRFQIAFVQFAHQMGQNFGVGLSLEDMPALRQQLTERFVVFNDPVVHQGDAVGLTRTAVVGVRVSIGLGGRTVGGPTGVGDALIGLGVKQVGFGKSSLQICNATHSAAHHQLTLFEQRATGRVVSPVLQPAKALKQDGRRGPGTEIRNNATHGPHTVSQRCRMIPRVRP